jgi:integrase
LVLQHAELKSVDELWRSIVLGFLVEKAQRTGSHRTAEVYGRTLRRFLEGIAHPAAATPLDVHAFAYASVADGAPPSPSTVCVRLAAISGFYDFATRMETIKRNPAANVRRPLAQPALPRGLTIAEVGRLLAAMPDGASGLLDRAITVTALLTGLRRTELMGLHLADAELGQTVRYEVRTKGGGVRRRELPSPAWQSIVAAADAGARVHINGAAVFGISDTTFYAHLRRYGRAAGLGSVTPHVLRHTAAKLRRQAGATIEEVSVLLGHRSIATTATYLRRLEDDNDDGWISVARSLGLVDGDTLSATRGQEGAGSTSLWRPNQEVRQGGCVNSRPVSRRGAQHSATLPQRDRTRSRRRRRARDRAVS